MHKWAHRFDWVQAERSEEEAGEGERGVERGRSQEGVPPELDGEREREDCDVLR